MRSSTWLGSKRGRGGALWAIEALSAERIESASGSSTWAPARAASGAASRLDSSSRRFKA